MTLLLGIIIGLLIDDAIVRLYRRVASKLPKSVLLYGKKLTDQVGITEPRGKIISLKELDALEAYKKGGNLEEILNYGDTERGDLPQE